jgi:hypothetical protein
MIFLFCFMINKSNQSGGKTYLLSQGFTNPWLSVKVHQNLRRNSFYEI